MFTCVACAGHMDRMKADLERESALRAEVEAKYRESEASLKSIQAKSKQLINALQQRVEEGDTGKVHKYRQQGWESSIFSRNSGFWMISGVILEICLNLRRKFVCVYVLYNCELQTPCAAAMILSAIVSRFSLSWVGSEAYCLEMA